VVVCKKYPLYTRSRINSNLLAPDNGPVSSTAIPGLNCFAKISMDSTAFSSLLSALPGAVATVLAGAIGAYAVLRKDKPPAAAANTPPDLAAAAVVPANKLARYPKRFAFAVAGAGLVLGLVVLTIGYSIGRENSEKGKKELLEQEAAKEVASYSELVKKGLNQPNLSYVMPSVIMLVTIERSPDGQQIIYDQRDVYELQALTDISSTLPSQANAFREEYNTRHFEYRIPGTDKEDVPNADFPNRWQVRFDVPKGERHAMVTGVHHVRPAIENIPKGLCIFENVQSNEETFCYTNDQNDVIGEVIIIIQSQSINLTPPGGGYAEAIRRHADGTPVPVIPTTLSLKDHPGIPATVVARFSDLKANEIAGVKVGWRTQ